MAITNLTNTKWIFSEDLANVNYNAESYNINFVSNGEAFTLLDKQSYRGYIPLYYGVIAAFNGSWTNSNYRTIEITGGQDVENADLIALLETAAIQVKEISGFTETKTALKIYEDLTAAEYNGLTKETNAFYLVNNVGLYKGETLIATNVDTSNLETQISAKQDTLVSGTNIKTINGESVLGSGNIEISGGTDVVANSGETTTDTLSTLKVGDTNYGVGSIFQRKLTQPTASFDLPYNTDNKYYVSVDIANNLSVGSIIALQFEDYLSLANKVNYGIVTSISVVESIPQVHILVQTCMTSSDYSNQYADIFFITMSYVSIVLTGIYSQKSPISNASITLQHPSTGYVKLHVY